MNRRGFFGSVLKGATAIAAAPIAVKLAEAMPAVPADVPVDTSLLQPPLVESAPPAPEPVPVMERKAPEVDPNSYQYRYTYYEDSSTLQQQWQPLPDDGSTMLTGSYNAMSSSPWIVTMNSTSAVRLNHHVIYSTSISS